MGGTCIFKGIDSGIEQLKNVTANSKMMILMTDGEDSNTAKAKTSAEAAKKEGIKIYTVGFGSGVNESLLKEIAEITGGEYRFASTENIIGITGSFMYVQQAENAEVLVEKQSTVAEGKTTEPVYFNVAQSDGDLMVSTAWPGSFLDTILTDPNGRTVDEEYPGAIIDQTQIPSVITVQNPLPGKWSLKIKGVETSYDEEPFYSIVSFKKSKNTKVNTQMGDLEKIAVYCVPIGFTVAVFGALLLILVNRKKIIEIEQIDETN
jgi:hypothetical protein